MVLTAISPKLGYKQLIVDSLWERLVNRIIRDADKTRDEAETIMNETLGFLKLCADNPSERFTPSKQVDIGWHAFLMYTREYSTFCERIAGRVIHHAPNDHGNPMEIATVRETIHFMQMHNIPFKPEIWQSMDFRGCDPGPPDCGEGDCNSDGNA